MVFRGGKGIVVEKFVVDGGVLAREELSDSADVLFRRRKLRNQRRADRDGWEIGRPCAAQQQVQIREDNIVRHAGRSNMRRTAPHLAVGKDMVKVRQNGAEIRLRHGKRRLDGRMDACRLAAPQNVSRELRLQERLAARKRDAAAMTKERQVAQELFCQRRARDRARIPCQCTRGAGFDDALPERDIFRIAGAVWDAADEDAFPRLRCFLCRRRLLRSNSLPHRPRRLLAELAADAAFLEKERPARRRDAFRIVAPAATKRAAFEENGSSDAGTIVRRETANVKNNAASFLRR